MSDPMSPAPKRNTTMIMVVVVVVAIILLALGYYLTSNHGQPQPTGKQPTTNQPSEQTGNQPAVPNEVYSYVGEVTNVGNGDITVLAKPTVNYLTKETTLTVKITDQTQIVRRTIPKTLPKNGDTANLFKQETIKASDLAKGDQVTVVSADNIKDKTDFTASRIEVLNIK